MVALARGVVVAAVLAASLQRPNAVQPARMRSGSVPVVPPQAQGWGEEWLAVWVDTAGRVVDLEPIRSAGPPFSDVLRVAVRGWRFEPARLDDRAVATRVLVAAAFRPAGLYTFPDAGAPPRRRAPEGVPVPVATPFPPYPARARGDGAVVVEVTVGSNGRVERAEVAVGSPAFNDVSLDTVRTWMFEPARIDGGPAAAIAYVVLAYREPVVVAPVPSR